MGCVLDTLKTRSVSLFPRIRDFRRHLHKNPETGFNTQSSEAYIRGILADNGVELLESDCGVLARIRGKDGTLPAVALRADIDALPLTELNDVPYKSQNDGCMHACGHDGHAAMLLGAAIILKSIEEELPHDVYLFFQPAEEGPTPGGALPMIESAKKYGYADKIGRAAALHLTTEYPTGGIFLNYGASMASTDEMDIVIKGVGGHVGLPHKAVDALSLAAHFAVEMESFMSRRTDPFDPAIFGIGKLSAGTARNIIAESASMLVTIRCQSEEMRTFIIDGAQKVLKSLCDAAGAASEVTVRHGLPVLKNNEQFVREVQNEAVRVVSSDNVKIMNHSNMGAEDFAFFASEYPVAFAWIGARNEDKGFVYMMHNPRFDFDEDALPVGTELLCRIALMK